MRIECLGLAGGKSFYRHKLQWRYEAEGISGNVYLHPHATEQEVIEECRINLKAEKEYRERDGKAKSMVGRVIEVSDG